MSQNTKCTVRSFLALAACKLSQKVIRLLRRGGTAMPGRIALKIDPDLCGLLARGVSIIAVTGTNGKTTTSRIIEQSLKDAGLDPIANRSGANLLSGITTELALHCTLTGRCRKKWAVIECDEAAARKTFGYLQPKAVVVTNLFRDQLDRYGEVTHTLENIREGLKKAPEALLCLNADCSLTSSLAEDLPNRALFFGFGEEAAPARRVTGVSDATHCLRCRAPYEYSYVTFAHLGGWKCPRCGYARRTPEVSVQSVTARTPDYSDIVLSDRGKESPVRVNLPADYNIYNAAAAYTAVKACGLDGACALRAISEFGCGFGRMERFALGAKGARMMLVKNPAGCNQVISFLENAEEPCIPVFCLNDRGADGTDISWIWDAEFERLAQKAASWESCRVSGIRAEDMALRLKYAGLPEEKIRIEKDYRVLADDLAGAACPVYIIPTYTAMLDFRAVLVSKVGGHDFWEG